MYSMEYTLASAGNAWVAWVRGLHSMYHVYVLYIRTVVVLDTRLVSEAVKSRMGCGSVQHRSLAALLGLLGLLLR